jgi:hypothetical protein
MMREVTSETGLTEAPIYDNWELPARFRMQYRFQTAVEDFDRDGDLDIAVATNEGQPLLLESDGGSFFINIGPRLGFKPWTNDWIRTGNSLVTWIDYDQDAYPDLIMGNRLYHNEQGAKFVDVTAESGLRFRFEPMGAVVADYDCDGRLDLYVLYQTPEDKPNVSIKPWVGGSQDGGANELWRNEGNGVFRNVTREANASGGLGQSFAASWLYLDDDRFPDLYIANDFGQNTLLRNRGDGRFEDVTNETGTGDFSTSMGVATGDLDNDGNPEIYVANMYSKMGRRIIAHVEPDDYPEGIYEQIVGSCAGNRLYYKPSSQSRFFENSEDQHVNGVGWAYAPAMVDLDGDGWLDLYATTGFMSFSPHKPDG